MRKHRGVFGLACVLVAVSASGLNGQSGPQVFPGLTLSVAKTGKSVGFDTATVELRIDEASGAIAIRGKRSSADLRIAEIDRAAFDTTRHRREGRAGRSLGAFGVAGAIAGAAVTGQIVSDHWLSIELSRSDAMSTPLVMKVPDERLAQLKQTLKQVLGDKVIDLAAVQQTPDKLGPFKDAKSSFTVKVDVANRPKPVVAPEKAVVILAAPLLSPLKRRSGPDIKLYANGELVQVQRQGSYGFVELAPGDYRLIAQSGKDGDGHSLQLSVEPGRSYHLLYYQDAGLARHSEALVMHELNGAGYAVWRRK